MNEGARPVHLHAGTADAPRSYIVRIYRFSKGRLVGQVEDMQTGSVRTFHTMRELWRVITSGTQSA